MSRLSEPDYHAVRTATTPLTSFPRVRNTYSCRKPGAELQIHLKLTHTEGECVMLKLSRLLWVVLLAYAFLALGNDVVQRGSSQAAPDLREARP